MALLCDCPVGTEIVDIPLSDCPENFGQIQKIIFQRKYSTGTTRNFFVIGSANPNLLASWSTLLAASDSTKVVQSPFVNNPVSEEGAAREFGGGNATLNGIPRIIGRNPSPFTCELHDAKQDAVEAMKEYMCENVQIYLVNELGKIGGVVDDLSSPVNFYGIPIQSLFISDKMFGGFESVDMNMIRFQFPQNWSDKFYVVTPSDFDALNDLVTP